MAKVEKRWMVETTVAESWDGKNGAPNVCFDSYNASSLEDARMFVQNKIGKIATNGDNKLEWINWTTTQVEVRFNYPNEGAGRVHQNYIMAILEVDENGILRYIEIGD
jgi:hypothetical protein